MKIYFHFETSHSYMPATEAGRIEINYTDASGIPHSLLSSSSRAISVGELESGNYILDSYRLDSHVDVTFASNPNDFLLDDPTRKGLYDIRYKLYWNNLPGTTLYIDNVVVHGNFGEKIFNEEYNNELEFQTDIVNSLKYVEDIDQRIEKVYGFDEPTAIDQYMAFNKVDKKVYSVSSGMPTYSSPVIMSSHITTGDNLTYEASSFASVNQRNTFEEFFERAQPTEIGMTQYFYDYPTRNPDNLGRKGNIDYYIDCLEIFEDNQTSYPVAIQGHGYIDSDGVVYCRPPVGSEILYNTQIALMHDANEIRVFNYGSYYHDNTTDYKIHGLTDVSGGNLVTNERYTYVKDIISPLLKGEYGKTMFKLDAVKSTRLYDIKPNTTISGNLYLSEIIKTSSEPNNYGFDYCEFDGTWIPENYHYFMLLRRPYELNDNTRSASFTLKYDLNLNNDIEWSLYDFVNNNSVNLEMGIDNKFSTDLVIQRSEGSLYSIAPTIEIGGTLQRNTVLNNFDYDSPHQLALVVGVNKTLSISGNFTAHDDLHIAQGASLYIMMYGNISFSDQSSLSSDNFSNALVNAKSNDLIHPKLIWAKPDNISPAYYKLYRNLGDGSGYVLVSSSISGNFYQDNSVDLYYGQESGRNISYYVKAIVTEDDIPIAEYSSNKVYYAQPGQEIGKEGKITSQFEYELKDNYPNPFNPTTQIKFSVAEVSNVKISVFNVLGEEIAILFDETAEPGEYELSFNGALLPSGVYICRMETNNHKFSKKMILTK